MTTPPAEAPAPDLVKRLRQPWAPSRLDHPLMTKAADELARLTADNERLRAALLLGKDCVLESFEYAKTLDDTLMAEARLRDIDAALKEPRT